MKCSNCGSEFDDGLNFCPHCGTSSHVITCPQCGEKYNNVGAYCPNCGYKLKEDSKEHVDHVEKEERSFNSKGSDFGSHLNLDSFKEHPWATVIACCCIGIVILSFIGGVLSPDNNTSDYDSNQDYSSNLSDDLGSSYNSSSSYDDDSSYSSDSSSDYTYDYDNIVFDNDGDNKLSLEEYAAMAVDLG
ncbi:MAG: zinc ribbon domain-containing protein, partial [Methanobrevibacter sp.]|uniref:zinc ribbon domain-containing protein n=1 Tax=Methanobrevibacter sp. TaxID=66852 RepID=UPI002E792743